MDRVEGREQLRALEELAALYAADHRFTADDVRRIHKIWLGRIYSWAGQYRRVTLTKDHFSFAAAAHIPKLMDHFEKGSLRQFTPCRPGPIEEVARALAVVHVEFVLIHPFREGNGRAARLLAVLMALQAGLPALYFEGFSWPNQERYFAAVRAGLDRNYDPMQGLFTGAIERTLRIHGSSID